MRSLEARTSEPKRASPAWRWTSSVSAALSSARETWVASERRPLRAVRASASSPQTTSTPRVSARTERPSTTAWRSSPPRPRSARRSPVSAILARRGSAAAPSSAPAVAGRSVRPATSHVVPVRAATTCRPSSSTRHNSDSASEPTSETIASSAARAISSRLVAATSAAPAPVSVRSRATERSCWRTRPAMRATTRPNRTADAAMMTMRSMSPLSMTWTASTAGAISDAPVRSARRNGVSFGSRSGAGRSRPDIDGCSAAAPQSR